VSGRRLTSFPLSNRPGSPTERIGAHLLRHVARRTADRGRLLRIALHPDDLERPGLRRLTVAALAEALDRGAVALPYAELVARTAAAVRPAAA
jgi:hypothetical protein